MANFVDDGLTADWRKAGLAALGSFTSALGGNAEEFKGEDNRRAESASRWDWRMLAVVVVAFVGAIVLVKKVLK